MKRTALYFLGAAALALGLLSAYLTLGTKASAPKFEAVDITGVDWGKSFELTDHSGHKRTLADFRGKAVTLFFGYTHCPDMCPTTMAKLGETMKLLGGDAQRVQGLFVTVDPQRDTPQVLAQYVPAFYPTFLGLFADPETIARTAKEFKVYYHAQAPNDQGSYTVDHSGQILVFDPEGRLRLMMKPEQAPESMAHDLRALLHQAAG
ncbi:MAG TPA: SCO family protein [Burkholderiales bacterium]|nr:SCO family protein [Burkholderiales bacterium]